MICKIKEKVVEAASVVLRLGLVLISDEAASSDPVVIMYAPRKIGDAVIMCYKYKRRVVTCVLGDAI